MLLVLSAALARLSVESSSNNALANLARPKRDGESAGDALIGSRRARTIAPGRRVIRGVELRSSKLDRCPATREARPQSNFQLPACPKHMQRDAIAEALGPRKAHPFISSTVSSSLPPSSLLTPPPSCSSSKHLTALHPRH